MLSKNNPFNIRTGNRWLGVEGSFRGFDKFETMDYGVRAACYLLMISYRRKGICRIFDIIMRFAPPSENATMAYIDYVCKGTGFSRNQIISTQYQYAKILSCMAYYESNTSLSVSYILQVISKFNISVYEKANSY